MTRPIPRLDIDRIHIKVLILVLAEQLRMTGLRAGGCQIRHRGLVTRVAVVAVRGQELGEDAADDRAQEGQARTYDGYVAFCGSPVGGTDVAVWVEG